MARYEQLMLFIFLTACRLKCFGGRIGAVDVLREGQAIEKGRNIRGNNNKI